MAGRVVWTPRAQEDRKEILEFWINHNKSKTYSRKLDTLFREATHLIQAHPQIVRPTDIVNVRIKIVREYLIFYEIVDKNIYILTICDSRQDPKSLEL